MPPARAFLTGLAAFAVTLCVAAGSFVVAGELAPPGATPRPTPRPAAVSAPRATAERTAEPAKAPKDRPGRHTVRPGETLFSIATGVGVSSEQLRSWNYKKHPSLRSFPSEIKVGWVLITTGRLMPTPAPAPTSPPPQTAAIPKFGPNSFPASRRVAVEFYAVTGDTPSAISQSIRASGPWSSWLGGNAQAHVRPVFVHNFRYQSWSDGACDVVITGSPAATFTYTVRLPDWNPPAGVADATVRWWADTITETVWHEAHHIELFESYVPALNDAITGGTCQSVSSDVASIAHAAAVMNCQFDLDEYGSARGLTMESCLSTN